MSEVNSNLEVSKDVKTKKNKIKPKEKFRSLNNLSEDEKIKLINEKIAIRKAGITKKNISDLKEFLESIIDYIIALRHEELSYKDIAEAINEDFADRIPKKRNISSQTLNNFCSKNTKFIEVFPPKEKNTEQN